MTTIGTITKCGIYVGKNPGQMDFVMSVVITGGKSVNVALPMCCASTAKFIDRHVFKACKDHNVDSCHELVGKKIEMVINDDALKDAEDYDPFDL